MKAPKQIEAELVLLHEARRDLLTRNRAEGLNASEAKLLADILRDIDSREMALHEGATERHNTLMARLDALEGRLLAAFNRKVP